MVNLKTLLLVGLGFLLQLAEASSVSVSERLRGVDNSWKRDSVTSSLSYENITSTLDQIISRGYLKVGVTGDYPPFTYLVTNTTILPNSTAPNSTYIGADVEAAQSLSTGLGLTSPVQFVHTSWTNLSSDLLAGNFDIAMGGITITLARATQLFFSTPILRGGKTACLRCSDTSKFTDLASIDTSGVTVVVNPGGTNEVFDRANLKSATILVVPSNLATYDAVRDGTAAVMISDYIEVDLQVALHPGELCGLASGQVFTFSELAYMMRRD
ncbi:Cyclohexadienyl dehydratase, partial [Lachnellula suecica]